MIWKSNGIENLRDLRSKTMTLWNFWEAWQSIGRTNEASTRQRETRLLLSLTNGDRQKLCGLSALKSLCTSSLFITSLNSRLIRCAAILAMAAGDGRSDQHNVIAFVTSLKRWRGRVVRRTRTAADHADKYITMLRGRAFRLSMTLTTGATFNPTPHRTINALFFIGPGFSAVLLFRPDSPLS